MNETTATITANIESPELEPELEIEGLGVSEAPGWGEEYPIDSVFIRTDQRKVIDVVRRIRDGRYDLNPDFQRPRVWTVSQESRLIESCLMRIPLPVFYVAESPDGRIIVIDGLQRLSTLSRFLDGKFKLTFSGDDQTKHPLEGKRFADLELKLQERIEDTSLTLYILDPKAPERAKLDIFERVNSGGSPLTRQQMRNCLHNGPATRWLTDAAQGQAFQMATLASLDAKSMRDREAINRFCAFSLIGWKEYRTDMDTYLARALEIMNKLPTSELEKLRVNFDHSMQLNLGLFITHAFRKSMGGKLLDKRSVLNIALFDVCSVLFAKLDGERVRERHAEVRAALKRLIEDKDFEYAITYSTNSRKQVAFRFERLEAELDKVLA